MAAASFPDVGRLMRLQGVASQITEAVKEAKNYAELEAVDVQVDIIVGELTGALAGDLADEFNRVMGIDRRDTVECRARPRIRATGLAEWRYRGGDLGAQTPGWGRSICGGSTSERTPHRVRRQHRLAVCTSSQFSRRIRELALR